MIDNPLISIPSSWGSWEVSANREWLSVRKKNLYAKVPMTDLVHCCVSCGESYVFRLITKDHRALVFDVKGHWEKARALFLLLNSFCCGFRDTPSTFTPRTWTCGREHIRLDQNELAVDITRLFNKGLKPYYRFPMRELVWVTQSHTSGDAESDPAYHLRLFFSNGKYYDLAGESISHCYDLALMFKDNAPQLRYGLGCFLSLKDLNRYC